MDERTAAQLGVIKAVVNALGAVDALSLAVRGWGLDAEDRPGSRASTGTSSSGSRIGRVIEGGARGSRGDGSRGGQPPEEACEFTWDGADFSTAYFDRRPDGSFSQPLGRWSDWLFPPGSFGDEPGILDGGAGPGHERRRHDRHEEAVPPARQWPGRGGRSPSAISRILRGLLADTDGPRPTSAGAGKSRGLADSGMGACPHGLEEAQAFTEQWVKDWNAHDVDALLAQRSSRSTAPWSGNGMAPHLRRPPSAWSYDFDADFDALCRRLYLQVKDGPVDREAAFDLACQVLSFQPLAADATELARLCLEDGNESGLTAAARTLLSEHFQPGFAEEPGWLSALEEALKVVNRDMRACGLRGTGHFLILDPRHAWVQVWDHHNSHGFGCHPTAGRDPVTALATVADDAQDAVMHAIGGAWPVCDAHSLGTHAEERDGAAVWRRSGGGGHVAAADRPMARDGAADAAPEIGMIAPVRAAARERLRSRRALSAPPVISPVGRGLQGSRPRAADAFVQGGRDKA